MPEKTFIDGVRKLEFQVIGISHNLYVVPFVIIPVLLAHKVLGRWRVGDVMANAFKSDFRFEN